jgi:hypothetical protein
MIMLFCGIWPFATNVCEALHCPEALTETFKTFYNLSLTSIGLMNSLAYGWNSIRKVDNESILEPVLDKTQILSVLNIDISQRGDIESRSSEETQSNEMQVMPTPRNDLLVVPSNK